MRIQRFQELEQILGSVELQKHEKVGQLYTSTSSVNCQQRSYLQYAVEYSDKANGGFDVSVE